MEKLRAKKKLFFRIVQDNHEYEKDALPDEDSVKMLREMGADIYTFVERTWCCPISNSVNSWTKTDDNVAMLEITTLDTWFSVVGKKTRNMVRRAEKNRVKSTMKPQFVRAERSRIMVNHLNQSQTTWHGQKKLPSSVLTSMMN